MSRIKIDLPQEFSFHTIIPVRITDLNYGGHVGNDTILTIAHEARLQFLQQWGYKELDLEGVGLIMADAGIEFKAELFYGETLHVHVQAGNLSRVGFDLYYKLEKEMTDARVIVAAIKTGMICYDYNKKKIAALPEAARVKLS